MNISIKLLGVIILVMAMLSACGPENRKTDIHPIFTKSVISDITSTIGKPIVDVYIENSGSMNGYVNGITEFEHAVYSYLSDISISEITDTLNLFYINSIVIPQGSDIEDFIQRLEPESFNLSGGNIGTSDIANVLDTVFSKTEENHISVLITDGIFSPGSGRDAGEYLVNQQIGIRNTVATHLNAHPNTGVIIYQLYSQFQGNYFNNENQRTHINGQRPYYIWLIGDTEQLNNLRNEIPDSKFRGGGVQNVYSTTGGNKDVNFCVRINSGNFKLDKKNPKNTILKLKKDKRSGTVKFSISVDFSKLLIDEAYIGNISNYIINKDYSLKVNPMHDNSEKYSHTLNLFSNNFVQKGSLSIKLLNKLPDWVEEANDNDGSIPIEGKTYGIKYQIEGVHEAFTRSSDYYTEIKISIN